MIFNPLTCAVLIIVFFLGAQTGAKFTRKIWKGSFEAFTEEVYEQYKTLLKDKDDEIERLKNKLN